ncbi:MAG: hypothetical protein DBY20_01770 [Coriobacteriia bacterium]|nr:MAG: hypothetical protein DBY20_01770 [Coriobacteriia bacterium]HJJ00860.1 hypothetical protein [Coriobacteriaceae bacterium]
MADKELLHKIVEMQERVIAQMDSLKDQDLVTNDLRKAADKAQEWARAVMKEEGNDKSYREWPPKQFAHELKKHINAFGNHEGTQLVREYEQLVGKLPYDADHEHV